MTLDELPGPLTDRDLVGYEPLQVVVADDLKPGLVRTVLGLPLWVVLAPYRVARAIARRPKLVVALVLAALVGALAFGYLSRQEPDQEQLAPR